MLTTRHYISSQNTKVSFRNIDILAKKLSKFVSSLENSTTHITFVKGTPLQIDDDRLSDFSPWLKKHNIVIVKLDSCQRLNSSDSFTNFVTTNLRIFSTKMMIIYINSA